MKPEKNLERFIEAQKNQYEAALSEITRGKKQGHWMWYIFPQIAGLGFSETSKFYAIQDLREAEEFLEHPILGGRLIAICEALLSGPGKSAHNIFGSPDDVKPKSSMTLFSSLARTNPVFESVLSKFFQGKKDTRTLELIEKQ